jgi:hypothetical protein
LDILLPEQGFTHVFGCEAWGYFPDKVQIYEVAYQSLKPGGLIAFLELASDIPLQFHFEQVLGLLQYESIANYTSMLESAGFGSVRHYDTTELVCQDILSTLYQQIAKREQIIGTVGATAYYAMLETWVEYLTHYSEGKATHCGFIAQKG